MDEKMKEALAEYLRDNLSIDTCTEYGYYGEQSVRIALRLDGKEISCGYVDIVKGSY